MHTFGKFVVKVLVAICVLVCSRAALEVVHSLGWYPERQLASLILAAPSALQIEMVMWSILAVVTVALWLLIDYFVYGRDYAALWRIVFRSNRPPNFPGVVWKKLRNKYWRWLSGTIARKRCRHDATTSF